MNTKQIYLKGNPRKFIDKIALIKQKEALTNASFNSAIHGINEITTDDKLTTDAQNTEIKDYSSNYSYSPDSFTSESTAPSFKNNFPPTNDFIDVNVNRDNDVFKSCNELSQFSETHHQPSWLDDPKYRHSSDRSQMKRNDTRYSNIEGYYLQNKSLKRLYEPKTSGSLPDVSVWNSTNEFVPKSSAEPMRDVYSIPRDYAQFQTVVSSTKDGKILNNTKLTLAEHLQDRVQQPYKTQSGTLYNSVDASTTISGSSIYRTRRLGLDHGDSGSVGNLFGTVPMAGNNDFLSLPHKPTVKEMVNLNFRHSHTGASTDLPIKYMKLNIDHTGAPNKTLTPTGYQRNTWSNDTNYEGNSGFLQPPMLPNLLANENWRRVASDSSIQNSLKYPNENAPQNNYVNDSSFERVHSLRREHVNHPYQRNQFTMPARNSYHAPSQLSDFNQDISNTNNIHALPPVTISIDSKNTYNVFGGTDNDGHQPIYSFPDLINRPGNVPRDHISVPAQTEGHNYTSMDTNDDILNSYVQDSNAISSSSNCDSNPFGQNANVINNNYPDQHECYWGQSNDEEMIYTNEPSPKTKPCENLDPQKIPMDIKADFSCIPEITINDAEAQRRDSLNWTVEVLKSLNNESCTSETFATRDRSLSGYQPMIALTEEEKMCMS